MKRIVKTKEILSLKNRESISQKLGVYAKKLGMGIASTYCGDISLKTPIFLKKDNDQTFPKVYLRP
jgi:hypothetical protein